VCGAVRVTVAEEREERKPAGRHYAFCDPAQTHVFPEWPASKEEIMQLGVPSNFFIDPWKEVIPIERLGKRQRNEPWAWCFQPQALKTTRRTAVHSVHASCNLQVPSPPASKPIRRENADAAPL
jgi:hypothetical protein